jgi:hypothetical protein
MEKACRIKIVRDGLEFEAEGDKSFVVAMLDRFEKPTAENDLYLAERVKPRKIIHGNETNKGPKTTSAGEFIRSGGITKHVDTVLAFGHYLEKYASVSAFTPADINNCYYEAKMEASNTSQMIIMNIRRLASGKRTASWNRIWAARFLKNPISNCFTKSETRSNTNTRIQTLRTQRSKLRRQSCSSIASAKTN